jgi:hypothetical protein
MMMGVLLLKNDGERDDKNDLEEREEEKEVVADDDDEEEVSPTIVFLISRFNDATPDRLILSSLLRRKSVECKETEILSSPSFRVLRETLNKKPLHCKAL